MAVNGNGGVNVTEEFKARPLRLALAQAPGSIPLRADLGADVISTNP